MPSPINKNTYFGDGERRAASSEETQHAAITIAVKIDFVFIFNTPLCFNKVGLMF
jgi:hypothetical protein